MTLPTPVRKRAIIEPQFLRARALLEGSRRRVLRVFPGADDQPDLPEPQVLAQQIAEDSQAAWEQFAAIAEKVKG